MPQYTRKEQTYFDPCIKSNICYGPDQQNKTQATTHDLQNPSMLRVDGLAFRGNRVHGYLQEEWRTYIAI